MKRLSCLSPHMIQFVYDAFEFYPIAFLRKGKIRDELPKAVKRICAILNEPNEMITVTATDGKINIRKKGYRLHSQYRQLLLLRLIKRQAVFMPRHIGQCGKGGIRI